LAAVIVFPLLFMLVKRHKVEKWVFTASVSGFLIAIVGLLMQNLFELISVVVVLFGLVFVMTVLLDKRVEQLANANQMNRSTASDLRGKEVMEEVAVTAEAKEEITLQPIEEDLARWMVANQPKRKEGEGRHANEE
jgi:dolichyl-phosphate-mannose--protein O-mannosyl transferase